MEKIWNDDGIVGIDEAGRGPLAGPVVAGAVWLPRGFEAARINDSKKLTEARREEEFERITNTPDVLWAVGIAEVPEIDRLNILKATHLAMRRAVEGLRRKPRLCLIDGLPVPGFPWPHEALVKGDAKSLAIAAASIVAKVTRDRIMHTLAREFPAYGFDRHKGYGTKAHLEALRHHGPCPAHRHSFQPVAQLTLPL